VTPFSSVTGCTPNCVDATLYLTNDPFPPCKPFFVDSAATWAFCQYPSGNIANAPCGNYILTKSASTSQTFIDTLVTFTITVCNNTAYATPVLLSEQLPPSFVVVSADTLWNGADTTLTLNNGVCAVLNITGYFTAFGNFTNTVNLDPGASGPPLSASADVSVVSTCVSEHIIPDGAFASEVGTVFSGTTVTIMGLFTVDEDVLFQNCQVFMEAGAEIVVLPGHALDVMSSSVVSCRQVMWKGITAQEGSTVRVRGSFVDDAENAVTALDGSTLWLRDNQFHNNRTTVHVPESEGVPWNNVAAYISGNTFYSQGAMPQPYPGQTTAVGAVGFAAFDLHYMLLSLTGGNNLIHTMSNGIVAHQTDLRVQDCRMQAIQPDAAYAYTGNGSGIYAQGGKGWYTLEQEGYGMDLAPSFEDCRWGIYTEYMNVYSAANRMLNMGTAYRVDRSGNREVDILSNRVECKYHGMDLRFNDGALHVLVENNDVTFGNDTECQLCRGYSAIQVSEANAANPNSVIQSNTLRFVPLTPSRFGVHMLSANDWLVQGNQVIMASQNSRTGIRTSGCQRVQVSCNEVTNADPLFAQYASEAQAAVRNWLGQDLLFSCNSVDRTTSGMLFSGGTSNTELRGNEFHQHRWGLHLENAVIGEQEHSGNLWFDPAPMNGFQAVCVPADNAIFSPFFVDPSIPSSGGNPMPTSISPDQGWFIPDNGQNFSCDDQSECAGFKERCGTCADSLWRKVADGTVVNAAYTSETRWILKGDLYKLLTEEPERLQGDGLLQTFYAEVEADVLAQLKDLEAEQLALYQLDASVLDALEQGAVQLAALRAQLHVEVAALGDSSLSATQLQAHAQAILGLQAGMAALLGYHGQALELAATGRALTAESVKATNAAIATGTLIEANHKAVNEVYLGTVAKDIDVFTPEQAAVLLAVADQCPLTGGNAVFRARALYSLIDDAQEYDDAMLCLQQGLITKRLEETVASACTVVPNPAREQATLVLSTPLSAAAWLVLTNALGAEVKRVQVPAEQMRTAFGIQGLAPGIYHYTLLNHQGAIGGGRLAIER
jgi:hypothetical protein